MASYEDLLVESGTFGETFGLAVGTHNVDGGTIGDARAVGVSTVFAEAGAFGEAYADSRATNLVEHGVLHDVFEQGGTFSNDVIERGRFSELFRSEISDQLVESAVFAEAYAHAVVTLLVESGRLTDIAGGAQVLTNLLVESGILADSMQSSFTDALEEAAVFGEAYNNAFQLHNLLVEHGTIDDVISATRHATNVIVERGALADLLTNNVNAIDYLVESGFIDDALTGGGAPGAWAAHLETFAMTRYTNTPWQSMAVVDGAVMALSEDGAYELTGHDDAGVAIAAALVGDLTDRIDGKQGPQSVPNHRRAEYVYVGYSADGALKFIVTETGTGAAVRHEITLPGPDGSQMIAARARLVPGCPARFFRFGFENVNGADFNINDARVLYTVLQRRV